MDLSNNNADVSENMVDLVDVTDHNISPSHHSIVGSEMNSAVTPPVSLSLTDDHSINVDVCLNTPDDKLNNSPEETNRCLDTPEHLSVESNPRLDTPEPISHKVEMAEVETRASPTITPPQNHADDMKSQLGVDQSISLYHRSASKSPESRDCHSDYPGSSVDNKISEPLVDGHSTADPTLSSNTTEPLGMQRDSNYVYGDGITAAITHAATSTSPVTAVDCQSSQTINDNKSITNDATPNQLVPVNSLIGVNCSRSHSTSAQSSADDTDVQTSKPVQCSSRSLANISFDELSDDSATCKPMDEDEEEEDEAELRLKLEKQQHILENLKKKEIESIANKKSKLIQKNQTRKSFEEGECSSSALDSSHDTSSDNSSIGENCDRCPICLTSLAKCKEIGTPESCDHCFCLECLIEWSKKVNTCPVDRHTFNLIFVRLTMGGDIARRLNVAECNAFVGNSGDSEEEDELTFCEVCHLANREDCLLLCDGCDAGYHYYCLTPALDGIPVNDWFCANCRLHRNISSADSSQEIIESSAAQAAVIVPRTLQSERVRAAIERVRLQRIVSSSPSSETGSTRGTLPVKVKKSSRKSSSRKKKRKSLRRSGRRKKTKKRRKHTTVKSRLANALGITKPRHGQTLPRSAADTAKDKAISILRGNLPSTSHTLCVTATQNTLDPSFSDSDNKVGHLKLSQAAQKYRMPIKTSNDVLGDILACQKNLHTNFDIEKDGSVKQNDKHNISKEMKNKENAKKKKVPTATLR